MSHDRLQQLLSPHLAQRFADYCGDEETIRLYGTNLAAEVEFLDEVGLDQRIATSSFAASLFLPESPLLEIKQAFDSLSPSDAARFAKLVQWKFRQKSRASQGEDPLDEMALNQWLAADLYQTNVDASELASAGEIGLEELPANAAKQVAEHVVANFPEISDYIVLVDTKSKALGYLDLRAVGKLDAPAAVKFNALRALFGDAGSKDWRRFQKISEQIKTLAGGAE